MRVLVVGGAGYIGSVTSHYLVNAGHDVVVLDNLSRGHREAVPSEAQLIVGDLASSNDVGKALVQQVDAVMHFAALSQVGESVQNPALYFSNNVASALSLLNVMMLAGVRNLIFSSTAAVYGEPHTSPITEDFPLLPTNPYGDSKLSFEKILKWYSAAYGLSYTSLRYFNAAGAFKDIGEDHATETHLIPIVLQTALGLREKVTIYGDDYNTGDGTCIRDYIHVKDLAEAHVLAVEDLLSKKRSGVSNVFNLGSGIGASVKQVIGTARQLTGASITAETGARRAGDPAILIASNERIQKVLGWSPKHSKIETIIADAWRFHRAHPHGYRRERDAA